VGPRAGTGRPNQKRRTRKALLQAASRLLKQGRKPGLEEIAEEALVSRATAYRYFPNVESLLIEAPLDAEVPEPAELFRSINSDDPVARVQRVDTLLHDTLLANEASFRMMLASAVQRGLRGDVADDKLPARQNRRTPLLDAALAPARHQFRSGGLKTLTRALALVVGTEAMVVFKDVLQLDDAEARKVKRWAIRALVEAAMKPDAQA
jgi:AcrR family transcriptional regulator